VTRTGTASAVTSVEPRNTSVAGRKRAGAAGLVREHRWALTVSVAMLGWTLVLFAIARDHYVHFRLSRYDLGNMVQAVWSTAHGRPLEITNGATGEQMVRLGSHVDPILALLAPLWIVAPSPLTLVFVQVAGIALGALPLFWLARRHLASDRVAALVSLGYLAYPWTAWAAMDVFHPVSLAIPLFLYCVWFLDTDRLVLFACCAAAAAACGELMGLTVAAIGVWYAIARGRRRAGVAIAVAGTLWTIVAVFVVVPAFSGGSSVFYGAFSNVGGSPGGVVRTAVTDPLTIVAAATESGDLFYLVLLAAPLAGGFLLAPGVAALAVPQLTMNLLAGFGATTDPRAHYIAAILPFLFAAIAIGLARLAPLGRMRGALFVLVASVAASVMLGPWPGSPVAKPEWYGQKSSQEAMAVRRAALSLVPDGAAVSATNTFGAHLSARRYVASVPIVARAEWIVLDGSDEWRPLVWGQVEDPGAMRAFRKRIEESQRWRTVFAKDGVFVFRRVTN